MSEGTTCVCIEYCRQQKTRTWTRAGPSGPVNRLDIRDTSSVPVLGRIFRGFMPEGYPDSVTPDYLSFQAWDSIQALMSYVRGMLCSQAILTGVGVGEKAATPLAAVFQFFVRDLAGMLGGVVFAFVQGSDLDIYAKQWRLFADCINNVGYVADLMSPLFPGAFLFLACIGSLSRAITGVAGGATRAALTQHFALVGNAADISAKEGSQETATTLIGMIVGMLVLRIVSGHSVLIWAIFMLLSVMHIYANIRAARSLRLTSLNPARLEILLADYLKARDKAQPSVLTPKDVAALEPLLPPRITRLWQGLLSKNPRLNIRMGSRLDDSVVDVDKDKDNKYILFLGGRPINTATVVLRIDCTADDVLEAYVHAYVALQDEDDLVERFMIADDWVERCWPVLRKELKRAGWSLEGARLCPSPWRGAWGSALHSHAD